MWKFGVLNKARAGCVRVIGYYGEPVSGWQCGAAWAGAEVAVADTGGFYRGSIRNNNQSYAASFSGFFECCYLH